MKIIILMTSTCVFNAERQQPCFILNQTYGDAIMAAGGIPVIVGTEKLPADYAQMADGLLITGGESVHPRYFGETFDRLADNDPNIIQYLFDGCNITRDEMEFALFHEFAKLGKPILGICRGMQLVNVATGGKNELDFPRHHPVEHAMGIAYNVTAVPDSLVGHAFGESFLVNSYHRDRTVSAGPDMRVTARSEDGIIEAIEHRTLPILGVQFHPERMRGSHPIPTFGPDSTAFFRHFVDLCKSRDGQSGCAAKDTNEAAVLEATKGR